MYPKVSIFLSATDVPKLDRFSQSDPFIVVSLLDEEPKEWKEVLRTVTMQNQKNPRWPDPILVEYKFEECQKIRFDMFDRDSKSEELEKQQFIGFYETTVSRILSSNRKRIQSYLLNAKGAIVKNTVLTIIGEVAKSTKDVLTFKFSAKKLQNKNLMGLMKSDPFYRICLSTKTGVAPVVVFESEHKVRTSSPMWQEQNLPLQRICNGDLNRNIRIEVHDWENSGKHKLIGLFMASVQELLDKESFRLINLKTSKRSTGTFKVDEIKVLRQPSFVEYFQGGCEVHLSVGIDFSAHNGLFSSKSSFHYVSEKKIMNQYQQAILSVGQVLQDYDSDQMLGAFGFGATVQGSKHMNSWFPLSLDDKEEELEGVAGILKAYESNLGMITPSDSCQLSELIYKLVDETPSISQERQSYSVILLLTTGNIDDFEETVEAIVEASDRAVSIVIVGIGRSDFSKMKHLDGNNSQHLSTKNGLVATRDIVQFVPYLDTVAKGYSVLREETLKELPEQVERFMWSKNILPKNKEG